MANEEHLKVLRQGMKVWNGWRTENRDTKPDLRKANLEKSDLAGVNLVDVNVQTNASNGSPGDSYPPPIGVGSGSYRIANYENYKGNSDSGFIYSKRVVACRHGG